jgi:hypothetical protein
MKNLFILLLISNLSFAQELKLIKATKQMVNHGASPSSSINYTVLLKKDKSFKWSIDSVHTPLGKSLKFNVVKVENMDAASPNYTKTNYTKKEKGTYQLTFGTLKKRGSGRPNSPPNIQVDTENFSSDVIIFYTVKGKVKQLKIDTFEELENINTP